MNSKGVDVFIKTEQTLIYL